MNGAWPLTFTLCFTLKQFYPLFTGRFACFTQKIYYRPWDHLQLQRKFNHFDDPPRQNSYLHSTLLAFWWTSRLLSLPQDDCTPYFTFTFTFTFVYIYISLDLPRNPLMSIGISMPFHLGYSLVISSMASSKIPEILVISHRKLPMSFKDFPASHDWFLLVIYGYIPFYPNKLP